MTKLDSVEIAAWPRIQSAPSITVTWNTCFHALHVPTREEAPWKHRLTFSTEKPVKSLWSKNKYGSRCSSKRHTTSTKCLPTKEFLIHCLLPKHAKAHYEIVFQMDFRNRWKTHNQQNDTKVKFATFPVMLHKKFVLGISLRMCLLHTACAWFECLHC